MNYENLEIWKRSRQLAIDVYINTKQIKDFGFKDQLTRCALSIPSNIAEGYERDYQKEKVRFLSISKGSTGEFKTQVDIGIEIGFLPKDIGRNWMDEAESLSRMIGKLITKLNN